MPRSVVLPTTQGLLDDCPRCGRRPDVESAEGAAAHLASCSDTKAIAAHTAAREAAEKRRSLASRGQLAQEEAMAVAQWEFGGRQVGQLWMLSEGAIRQQCELYNVRPEPEPGLSKPKLIAVLAKALRAADKGRLLTDGSVRTLGSSASQRPSQALPSPNRRRGPLHTMRFLRIGDAS